MNTDGYYDSFSDGLEEGSKDPNFRGAFAGGPPILPQKAAKKLFEDPAEFERRAREALAQARAKQKND